MQEKAEALINEAKADLEKEQVTFDASSTLGSNPTKASETIAKQENFSLIILGSRGLGGKVSILLGSVSKTVVGNAYYNVLVVEKIGHAKPTAILPCFDLVYLG